jgi:hypothetical protein
VIHNVFVMSILGSILRIIFYGGKIFIISFN